MCAAKSRKRLLLQGATGSIGESTLSVVREQSAQFQIVGLSAGKNIDLLFKLAAEFDVESMAIEDETQNHAIMEFAKSRGIRQVYWGTNAAEKQAEGCSYDLMVNAIVGNAGMEPTLTALNRGISVALANKETLVAAGSIILEAAKRNCASVIPIDSEHSAIFQCLLGERRENLRTIWLTTSGGPFWDRRKSDLSQVTVEQALGHPTWTMGAKISVDSATMFNKGLEVIEAARLFEVSLENIHIIVHRQSIMHSMVEFIDGSLKAQLSFPDMRLPILFALSYPDRQDSRLCSTRVRDLKNLTFEEIDIHNFPCLELALVAMKKGGTTPAALSAADEIAVAAFLEHKIAFTDISRIIEATIHSWPEESLHTLNDARRADQRARVCAQKRVEDIMQLHGVRA